jgi:microsomal dipeptidase-like Zn-dependent dipeptidase/gamma-glutamyl-gamma-aminobutyrate hydrolase PuuD
MNRFSLPDHLSALYRDVSPQSDKRPVIGITGNYGEQTCKLGEGYYQQVLRAGGIPLIIPPTADKPTILQTLSRIDGLLLSGGADINPLFCGEEPSAKLGGINAERDLPELLIARLAFNRQMPILGICRGIQTMAVALGGKVAQDLSLAQTADGASPIKHSQEADRSEPTHTVILEEGSTLRQLFSRPVGCDSVASPLPVNSFHHQAVSNPGPHFRVSARAKDGIIEAIESSEMKPFMGVQWHPECMGDDGQPLFRWLVGEAKTYRKTQQLHDRILTLDTHCDTPMFFPQNVDFGTRDGKILVDLPKMTEGRLDATIMVCYLPQPKPGETFQQNVAFDVAGPKAYADLIFDKIGDIVSRYGDRVALARTPNELWQNKQTGKKSIMLGIENGLALEADLGNVEYFQQRGVVYITLCHNGDNAICDSARGSQTHGGVSAFGAKVIAEMNRHGLMVDLSHAAESSFYDALQISRTPIVCSHSSARTLCDHPRNLTDDQMRALAQKGGVCQITLYNGFLVKDGKATILDAMAHLDHAIRVMGIDHVGLGTDFDGDGGVCGLADASELTLFTRQLLARRYSEADIQKIWGGNFLRVMGEVQRQV